MPNCTKCNKFNNSGVISCIYCGTVIVIDEGYYCVDCGAYNGPFAKRCKGCHIKLHKNHVKPVRISSNRKPKIYAIKSPINYQMYFTFLSELDPFTIETLIENYELISKDLDVIPKVIVHKRGTHLPGGVGGHFDSTTNTVELVDNYYLISGLAHEMRHAYQFKYRSEIFFNTHITTAKEYIQSPIEKDARNYARNYCEQRRYFEELDILNYQEKQFELFVKGALTATAVGLDDDYFRKNPIYPQGHMNEDKHCQYQETFRHNQNLQWEKHQKDPIIESSIVFRFIIILLCVISIYLYLQNS